MKKQFKVADAELALHIMHLLRSLAGEKLLGKIKVRNCGSLPRQRALQKVRPSVRGVRSRTTYTKSNKKFEVYIQRPSTPPELGCSPVGLRAAGLLATPDL
jgi:hypothetical protein